MSITRLPELLDRSAKQRPDKVAVSLPGGPHLTYAELANLSDRLRDRLHALGVRRGDRVGFRLHKSLDSIVTLFGIMKAGAAYVPVDPMSPASRGAYIFNDCEVKVVVTEARMASSLAEELANLGATPLILALDAGRIELPIRALLDRLDAAAPAPAVTNASTEPDDIAYILYTSGSTGSPKGVVLSYRNAASFIDWVSDTFGPVASDVFASHAPFHFDMSIFDLYVPLKHGARLVLITELLGKDPARLAPVIAAERISIWFSTPSILSLLADYGRLELYDWSALRIVFFAGEVFPIPRFRTLRAHWTGPRFVNMYGPTETNVCTFYEVPADESWTTLDTFPIGGICVPNQGRVVNEAGVTVAAGTPGELVVTGPNVMQGYWNLPEQNQRAFLVDETGRKWYRTGDIVVEECDGQYKYLRRRDRMVKRRGYRVELGEIEVGLLKHPDVREAAVVAVPGIESGLRIAAFVSCAAERTLSTMLLRSFCTQHLPPYMVPDIFSVVDALPRTSTDKTDYQVLTERARA